MQLKKDAKVMNSDDKEVGRVDRVVIDPHTQETTHIVIHDGRVHMHDKVVPMGIIDRVQGDNVLLRTEVTDLSQYPDFEETSFIPYSVENPDEAVTLSESTLLRYPLVSYGAGGYDSKPDTDVSMNSKENTSPQGIALQEGAEVHSRDGKHIGDIESILTYRGNPAESQPSQVTHLLVSYGLLKRHRKLIPIYWVNSIKEDVVHLAVDASVVDAIADYSTDPRSW